MRECESHLSTSYVKYTYKHYLVAQIYTGFYIYNGNWYCLLYLILSFFLSVFNDVTSMEEENIYSNPSHVQVKSLCKLSTEHLSLFNNFYHQWLTWIFVPWGEEGYSNLTLNLFWTAFFNYLKYKYSARYFWRCKNTDTSFVTAIYLNERHLQ